MVGLTATIVAVTVFLAPPGAVSLGLILLVSSLGIYGIARPPTFTEGEHAIPCASIGSLPPLRPL
ncbi:MAG: hypothetical protein U0790_08850 [Isosphaeraceae bacterium]